MADFSGYGLDPAIVNYVQGMPLGVAATQYPPTIGAPIQPAPPPAPPPPDPTPPPPPTRSTLGPKGHIGLFGAPSGDEVPSYGLDPAIVAHVQGAPVAPPETTTPSVTGGALPTDAGMAVAPTAQPTTGADYVAGTAPDMTKPGAVAKSNAAYDKRTAAQAAYDASPEGLAAKADTEQRQAIGKEQQANNDALAAEQAQNTATANALTASQQRQAKQDEIDNAKIAEQQANVDKYTQQYAQQVKDAADYKVDTNRDVGVRGLIAIALSGIGNALDHNHGPNAAAQIIESQIDKRIADQWAQKKALGDKAQETKGVMQTFRQNADDDRQAQALHTAAETKRTADEIRTIGAQYANPAAKARAEAVAAQLDNKSALITQNEAVRKAQAIKDKQEEADRRAQIGIAAGHLALAQKTADREFALKTAELDAKTKAGADPRAALSKELSTNGVFDPTSGNAVLTADGQKVMDQADALEVKARSLPPDQQAAARQQAAQMRKDAELLYGFKIEDKEARRDVVNAVGAGQKLVDTVKRIKDQLAKDPSMIDRSAWAGLETDFESAKADWIELHKGKPSSREFDAIGPMFGDDPGSIIARLTGQGKMNAALDQLNSIAISDTTTDLHKHGYKGTWRPHGLDTDTPTPLSGKTSVEAAQDAEPGSASFLNPAAGAATLGHAAYNAVTGGKNEDPTVAAENSADTGPTGLSKQDTATVESLVNRYKKAPDAERGKILATLTTYASSERTPVANGVLGLVKQDPELYKSLVGNLSPQQQDATIANAPTLAPSVEDLATAAKLGDVAAQTSLIHRAATGDVAAKQALQRLTGGR